MGSGSGVTDPLEALTNRQRQGLIDIVREVRTSTAWSWTLPVLLHDPSWLRLLRIDLSELRRCLPPDGRHEAPELIRYRALLNEGVDALLAQQTCWDEFGMKDCQRALQLFWAGEDQTSHGWTISRYLELVSQYKQLFEQGHATVPMLVLAQKDSRDDHELHWVADSTPMMRHTCA